MLKAFALPVQVANVWSTKFGIMLERVIETVSQKVSSNSVSDAHSSVGNVPQLPIVFALLHPLDEVSPVLAKHGKYNAWRYDTCCFVQALYCIEPYNLSRVLVVVL